MTDPKRHQQAWLQLYRYVYARVQNRQEAEDLTQEAYLRAIARGRTPEGQSPGGPGDSPSRSYLQMVALNLIRDRWRRHRAHGVEVPLEEAFLGRPDVADDAVHRAWVRSLVAGLLAEHRTVLELRIVAGYSRAETARRMGRTEDSIRGLQYRAIQALRRLMMEQKSKERAQSKEDSL